MVWTLDDSSFSLTFSVRHLMLSTVQGRFKQVEVQVDVNPEQLERAQVSARIAVASITTGDAGRDEHLRSAEFFDVERFPHITFQSTSFKTRGDRATLVGDLTIKSTTRPQTLEGRLRTAPNGSKSKSGGVGRLVVNLQGELYRGDFGLVWSPALEAGGMLVSKNIQITLSAQLVER